jgi:hypothetical protein
MSRRILIVANLTLASDELKAAVDERVRRGATELFVVVPAGAPTDAHTALHRMQLGPATSSEPFWAAEAAERRLDAALKAWAAFGVPVSGEVADGDASKAVANVLARRTVDEIIVSTQPTGISHWLRTDLPNRLHRTHKIPVSTVTTHKSR